MVVPSSQGLLVSHPCPASAFLVHNPSPAAHIPAGISAPAIGTALCHRHLCRLAPGIAGRIAAGRTVAGRRVVHCTAAHHTRRCRSGRSCNQPVRTDRIVVAAGRTAVVRVAVPAVSVLLEAGPHARSRFAEVPGIGPPDHRPCWRCRRIFCKSVEG